MSSRAEIVAEARSWIGTPFRHQATLKNVGVDCAGLVRGTAVNTGCLQADYRHLPRAAEFLDYARSPDGIAMLEACEMYMVRISQDAMQPGDAILLRFEKDPQHLGILGDYRHGGLSIIHAASNAGRVIETRLMFGPRTMQFVAAFALPGVA